MYLSKACATVCLTAALCAAETINIRGSVKDSADAGISGATVKLERGGISATTGADGSFALTGSTGIQTAANNRALAPSPVQLSNGKMTIMLSENAPVAISSHDIAGRIIYKMQGTYGSGTHAIRVPVQNAGLLLYTVTIGSEAYSLKFSPPGHSSAGLESGSNGSSVLSGLAKVSAVIADVISVVGEGYLNYRDSIKTSDTSGIVIKMIPNAGNVTDINGNVYQSVKIGNQVWTVENLRATKFNDGTPIPLVTDKGIWSLRRTPVYSFYNNTTDNAEQKKWGALYNFYAVKWGKLAPAGWHMPTDAEWNTLESTLSAQGYNNIAKALCTKTNWIANTYDRAVGNDPGKNNASGFSALPAGCRSQTGEFMEQNYRAFWWTATESGDDPLDAILRQMHYISDRLGRTIYLKMNGFPVRLVRD